MILAGLFGICLFLIFSYMGNQMQMDAVFSQSVRDQRFMIGVTAILSLIVGVIFLAIGIFRASVNPSEGSHTKASSESEANKRTDDH